MSITFAVIALWPEGVVNCIHFDQDALELELSSSCSPTLKSWIMFRDLAGNLIELVQSGK